MKPSALRCGYTTIRADQISKPGIITHQIIQHLVDDPLVIADLTEHNPNVFYELAIRHALRKPLVQMIATGETLPFDVSPTRTIGFDLRNPDSIAECRRRLIQQIRSVERTPTDVDNPISSAIDLRLLRRSKNPQARTNATIIDLLDSIRWMVSNIQERQRYPRKKRGAFTLELSERNFRLLDKIALDNAMTVQELIRERVLPDYAQMLQRKSKRKL